LLVLRPAPGAGAASTSRWLSRSRGVPAEVGKPKQDDMVGRVVIQGILDETEALPAPQVLQGKVVRLTFEKMPRFSWRILNRYQADYPSLAVLDQRIRANPDRFRLIGAVRRAAAVLENNAQTFSDTLLSNRVPIGPKLKLKILKDQAALAVLTQTYQDALEELGKAGARRAGEKSLRWQANYDYVRTRLLARLIHVHEYNLMLGRIRRDDLPPLQGGTGWRLLPRVRPQNTDRAVKRLVTELQQTLRKIIKEHPDTPWAVLARRDLEVPLGLQWQPFR
jgi:hypothetical protein